jgi:hypothetical protein
LINLGFTTERNLLLCSSYLPLGVPNWVPTTHHHQAQGVCKYTKLKVNMQYKINKYANATAPENPMSREYAN